MERALLFRFHKNPEVCKNRLKLLKKLNPDTRIFGLGEDLDRMGKITGKLFEDNFVIDDKDSRWKWKNGDLAVRRWFKEFGNKISFDLLHVIEWDLLLFSSLKEAYKGISKDNVGITAPVPIKDIREKWPWISEGNDWEKLLRFVKREFGYDKEPYGCAGPGVCLPRKFLKKYSKIDVPELCNDEVRIPLFSQILGFELQDTGFCKRWFSKEECKYFNSINKEIELSVIEEELSKKSGRRVFHPYREKVDIERLLKIKSREENF